MDLNKIKVALQSILLDFGKVVLSDGQEVEYEGEEFKETVKIAIADGQYTLEDGRVFSVVDGFVTEIKEVEQPEPEQEPEVKEEVEAEEEVEEVEEVKEEEPEPETEEETEDDYEARISALEEKIAQLEEKLLEVIAAPVQEPIAEEFSKIDTKPTGKNSATISALQYLRK